MLTKHPARLLIACVGDLVDGEGIYDTQAAFLDHGGLEQALAMRDALWAMLLDLRAIYKGTPIDVHFVRGNHGRASKTAHPTNNLDLQLGHAISDRVAIRNDSHLGCVVHHKAMARILFANTVGLLHHKGLRHLGTPAYKSKFLSWCVRHDADWMACGHWHHARLESHQDRWLIGGGSLCGEDDLSEDMACYEAPRQSVFTIDNGKLSGFTTLEF